ncbi:MAG TPA: CBU_0585 family protein [Gammaproteobacteria bacterium]|jgi:hypothetical protein|nr:CBU_0585 family protein [Gammaproteobacteria bacterium]
MINAIKWFLNLQSYVSPLDAFLSDFRKSHATPSVSQRKEQLKHARVFTARDKAMPASLENQDGF